MVQANLGNKIPYLRHLTPIIYSKKSMRLLLQVNGNKNLVLYDERFLHGLDLQLHFFFAQDIELLLIIGKALRFGMAIPLFTCLYTPIYLLYIP